jgi:hypothetical protein
VNRMTYSASLSLRSRARVCEGHRMSVGLPAVEAPWSRAVRFEATGAGAGEPIFRPWAERQMCDVWGVDDLSEVLALYSPIATVSRWTL